jgi:pyruvate/2-oxoglutarate dehydrogenase complex dihydrolipoamide acyltransferase (E2) component
VEKFAAAMRNNGSYSATLDMKLPMMMEGNFEPHFSVKHMLKDVVIATRLARNFGIEFGATDASRHGLTEEMRQGRGDADYSSLFRQYFPSGSPMGGQTNGEDDQPRLAGIDEGKSPEPAAVPEAVETTAEVPSEAKEMGEVVQAPAAAEPAAEAKTEVPQEVAGPTAAAVVADARSEETKPAEPEPAVAAKPAPVPESKPKEEAVLTFPAAVKEGEGEEPRGLWGGFWRRRED